MFAFICSHHVLYSPRIASKSITKASQIKTSKKQLIKHRLQIYENRLLDPKNLQEPPTMPQEPPRNLPTPKNRRNPPPTKKTHLLGGFWSHVGPKIHQKVIQNACKILIDFDIDFASIFHRFWNCFGWVLGAMLASKMHHKLSSNFELAFDWFFIDF